MSNSSQRSFLDPGYMPPQRARASDPAPSQDAAAAIKPKLAGLRQIAYERAVNLCGRYGDVTANEIGYLHEADDGALRCESIRKRVKEISVLGFLVIVGERTCRRSGSKVTMYKVKPQ